MANFFVLLKLIIFVLVIDLSATTSSPIKPFATYDHAIELEKNIADLWWTVNSAKQEITFELHIKTTGWISLGISPAGGMIGADIGVGWVDQTGQLYFQDRYAFRQARPIRDDTTTDWFGIQGLEANGWTAIQFKRAIDTCDIMDVPIKSGTNNIIFAYGLTDPNPSGPNGEISFHEGRRGSRSIPLQSYANPPTDDTYAELDYFEFRLNNYVVPPTDTTYHCKIHKAPSKYNVTRHAIGHKTLVDPNNHDLVHHLLMYECDATATFDDNNLPDGPCDEIYKDLGPCASNIATGWAVGGDYMVGYPEEAGYPIGGNFSIKYYMIQMHYDNPGLFSNRTDSSGIRFYVGKQLRTHDIGYFTLGADSSSLGLAIPPKVEKFVVNSYCSVDATKNFPKDGITIVSAFPHTHLQGRTVWTKLIRNKTAVDYLFNADAFNFNYQYENRLPKPMKLYPGDEFATQCIYNTMDKDKITLGGESTRDEMCLHMFIYYPRMENLYGCVMSNDPDAFAVKMNASTFDYNNLTQWLLSLTWTPEQAEQWQKFYDTVPRVLMYGAAPQLQFLKVADLPTYEDIKPVPCIKGQNTDGTTPAQDATTKTTAPNNLAVQHNCFVLFHLISMFIVILFH